MESAAIGFRVDPELRKMIEKRARRNERTIAQEMRVILREALKEEQKDERPEA